MIGGNASGSPRFDYVVDAIDSVKAKAALIAYCRDHKLPLVTIGGAGGQLDPTRIEVRDLARTEQEPLLKKVRKLLSELGLQQLSALVAAELQRTRKKP